MTTGRPFKGLRGGLILAAMASVLAVAAWLVRDFVRDTIAEPVFVAIQWILVYVRSVPEDFYWLMLLGLGVFSALRTIGRQRRPRRAAPQEYSGRGGAARELMRWTIAAGRNPYYRRRIAELLGLQLCRAARVDLDRGRVLHSLHVAGVTVPDYLVRYLGAEQTAGWRERLLGFGKRQAARELQRLEDAVGAVEAQVGVHEQRQMGPDIDS